MKRILILLVGVAVIAGLVVYIPRLIRETVESAKPGQRYLVALGDSVAAGAGLNDDGGRAPAGCDLADGAFPFLLGQQLHKPVEQFACSGATVATVPDATNSLLSMQYPAAKPFLADGNVVVYAGANDIDWLQTLTSCVKTNCATAQNRTAITGKLRLLRQNLTSLLGKVQQAHPRRLVVNTYYGILAPGDTCVARLGITPQEVSFINDEEAQLNAVITVAATQTKATVVAVDFTGHTLCSANSWIQGVSASAPLHPTAAGQQQIATQDLQAFTVP